MATATVYNTYRFKDKDPAIDKLRTVVQDSGKSYVDIHVASGVTVTTLRNWFKGGTRRPQHATLMAVARSLGYDYRLVKQRVAGKAKKVTGLRKKLANGARVHA